MEVRQGASALTDSEARELVDWFTRSMSMEMRHALMAERPVQYAKMFPSVSHDTIAARVTTRIMDERYESDPVPAWQRGSRYVSASHPAWGNPDYDRTGGLYDCEPPF